MGKSEKLAPFQQADEVKEATELDAMESGWQNAGELSCSLAATLAASTQLIELLLPLKANL